MTNNFSKSYGCSAKVAIAPRNQESPKDPSLISVGSIYFLNTSGLKVAGFKVLLIEGIK